MTREPPAHSVRGRGGTAEVEPLVGAPLPTHWQRLSAPLHLTPLGLPAWWPWSAWAAWGSRLGR